MVDLVLQAGRHQSLGFDLVLLAVEVEILDLHLAWPFDLLVILRDRQAAFLVFGHLVRFPDNRGIDEHMWPVIVFLLRQIHRDDAFGDADLDRREPDAGRLVHGLEQVIDQFADTRVDLFDPALI